MAKFCGKCGSMLDLATGKCPVCDKVAQSGETVKLDIPENLQGNPPDINAGIQSPSYSQPGPEQNAAPIGQFSPGTQQAFAQGTPYTQPVQTKPHVKNKNTAARIIITCLLGVLFFAFFIGLTAVVHVRNLLSSGGVSAIIENVEVKEAIEGFDGLDLDNVYSNAKENLRDVLGKTPTDKQIESLIKDTSVKDFIADKLGDAAEAFLDGEEATVRIEKSEIDALLRENKREFERILDTSISTEELRNVTERLFDEGDELNVISTRELTDRVPAAFYAVRYGLSYLAIAVLAILCVVVFIIMAFTNYSLTSWLCGISMSLVGIVCILLSVFSGLNLFRHGSDLYRVALLGKSVFSASLPYSVVVAVIGVSLIVSSIVSIIIKKKKAR